jgi:hypothetical protein
MPAQPKRIDTNPDIELRTLLTRLIRRCPKSRETIAEEMSVHAGLRISKYTIDGWTAKGKKNQKRLRFPAFLIATFCQVTGSDELHRWAAGRLRTALEFGERALEALERRKAEEAKSSK